MAALHRMWRNREYVEITDVGHASPVTRTDKVNPTIEA